MEKCIRLSSFLLLSTQFFQTRSGACPFFSIQKTMPRSSATKKPESWLTAEEHYELKWGKMPEAKDKPMPYPSVDYDWDN